MNRREFLRRALSLAPAVIVAPAAVAYFLPPRGGWPTGLTVEQVRRAKAILEREASWVGMDVATGLGLDATTVSVGNWRYDRRAGVYVRDGFVTWPADSPDEVVGIYRDVRGYLP